VGLPLVAEQDFMTFSATYGKGIGSDLNDAPPDAVFLNASGDGIPLPITLSETISGADKR